MHIIGIYSYGLTAFLFTVICTLLLTKWRGRINGMLFFLFCLLSIIWAASIAISFQSEYSITLVNVSLELLRNEICVLFLMQIHSAMLAGRKQPAIFRIVSRIAYIVPLVLLIMVLYLWIFKSTQSFAGFELLVIGNIIISITILSMLEQVFHQAGLEQRWAFKFLCFGLAAMYAFDFYLYSDALMFKQLNFELWEARGIVYAIAVPMIAIAISRNPLVESVLNVSRSVVFYTTGIVASGVYLIIVSAGGFYLQAFGGQWGGIVASAFIFSGLLFLLVLFFSGQMRARIRVFIDKHFLNYKYDYREQWLGLIRELSSARGTSSLEQKALHALTEIMDSPGGVMLVKKDANRFSVVSSSVNYSAENINETANGSLARYFENWQWVVNLDEFQSEPELYHDLVLPNWLKENDKFWLVIPLMLQLHLYGFVVIERSRAPKVFNWEDIDLLKTAGRQVAIHLAQEQSALALVQARQFEAFNRFSAYVVHDLKNLVSQLALIVKNAEKHKHNPDFMEDTILTVDNAVERMNRMLAQLRSGTVVSETLSRVNVHQTLKSVIKEKSNGLPVPKMITPEVTLYIKGNSERLITVLGHLVQNAQDATVSDGFIHLSLHQFGNSVVISIEDNGAGMEPSFIANRLFKPFDTTKGLAGMGIGAHESRSFIEELNGNINVDSVTGKGTVFTITLPLYLTSS